MLPACATDLLATVPVEGVIQDGHHLGAFGERLHDHQEDPFGHVVRLPQGSGEEPIDTDEVLRLLEFHSQNHVADRVLSHSQHPSGEEDQEVTQTRCAEALPKIYLFNLKRLWYTSVVHGVPSPSISFITYGRNAFLFQPFYANTEITPYKNGKTIAGETFLHKKVSPGSSIRRLSIRR